MYVCKEQKYYTMLYTVANVGVHTCPDKHCLPSHTFHMHVKMNTYDIFVTRVCFGVKQHYTLWCVCANLTIAS